MPESWQDLARALVAELIGTMFLVLIGCGAAVNWKTGFDVTQVSLAFGLAVMAIASFTGHVSGGNLNPAVSVGLLAGGRLPLVNAILYIVVQCIGAVIGAGILHGCTPTSVSASLAANGLGPNNVTGIGLVTVAPGAGFVLEALLTMLLVLVVFATAVDNKTAAGLAPLLIGLTVTAAHLVLIPYTGTSINPARSLGPAFVKNIWESHWVFWVGPLVGGALGGLLYTFVFSSKQNSSAAAAAESDSRKV